MTRKILWENPYLAELEATVSSVEGNDITLDRTIFFAQSGGQESDHGSIGGHPVLETRKKAKILFTA